MNLTLIIAAFIIGDFIFVVGIIALCIKRKWAPIARAHPAQTPTDDAVTKTFQSYRFDLLNLGFCIHTTVDENYLHLTPVKFLQKLGAKPTSIAWKYITHAKPSIIGKIMSVRIGKHRVSGPTWCLQLAIQDEDELNAVQEASNG